MAEKSVVKHLLDEPFFDAMIKVVAALKKSYPPVFFAALVESSPESGKFAFLFGSHSINPDAESPIPDIVKLLRELLPEKFQNRIQQVTIVQPSHPFVQMVGRALRVTGGGRTLLSDASFDGVMVDYAVIFHSDVRVMEKRVKRVQRRRPRAKRR